MSPTVRAADPADVSSMGVVRRQAVEAGFEGVYDRAAFAPLVASPDDDLGDWVASDDHLALVVETDVTVAAFGVYDRPDREVRALYTAPHYQGRGCATALLDRFEARAREDGASAVRVVAPRNAVPFFTARGFRRRGTVDRAGLRFRRLTKPLD